MREARNSGLTLVEMTVVTVILLILGGAIGGMAIRGQDAQTYVERQAKVTTVTQDLIERVRADVATSRRLFGNDTEGQEYLAGLDRTKWPAITSRLPTLDSDGIFTKDKAGSEKTGNVLLFALHDRTDKFDLNEGVGEKDYVRIDVYRLVAFYLRKSPGKNPNTDVDGLDLVRWVSLPLVDKAQVDAIIEPTKRMVLRAHLYSGSNPESPLFPFPPARLTWEPGKEFGLAFERILEDGSTEAVAGDFKVPADERRTRPKLVSYMKLSVASNAAGATRGVAKFGLKSSAGDGFPHGFETQIVGVASARQVLVHVTVVSNDPGRHRAWLDLSGIAAARDL